MNIIDKIKDIIFKIKDYDRLEHDYCYCLCYFTNNRMSKPNYKIEAVSEVILESVGEYKEEGYNEATRKAIEWLREQDEMIGVSFREDFLERFKKYMKGE